MAINETATGKDNVAITGTGSAGATGVYGASDTSTGVIGKSQAWAGVYGESETGSAVYGKSNSTTGGVGVLGEGVGAGVLGKSQEWVGVAGESETSSAVWGHSKQWIGVLGESDSTTTGAGVYGKGGRVAGYFEGDVEVTGDIRLTNADCAEDFDIAGAAPVEPGTVMVLGDEDTLKPSEHAYDKRVAGVLSGAGDYKPGIVLDKQPRQGNRSPVALLGKVFCKVDAGYGSIEVGDLLTTSETPGHAMKAADPFKAFGSVIGKALRPFKEGQGLIPILIALQ